MKVKCFIWNDPQGYKVTDEINDWLEKVNPYVVKTEHKVLYSGNQDLLYMFIWYSEEALESAEPFKFNLK